MEKCYCMKRSILCLVKHVYQKLLDIINILIYIEFLSLRFFVASEKAPLGHIKAVTSDQQRLRGNWPA